MPQPAGRTKLGAPFGEGEAERRGEAGVREDGIGRTSRRQRIILRRDGDDPRGDERAAGSSSREPLGRGGRRRAIPHAGTFVDDRAGESVPGGFARGGEGVGAGALGKKREGMLMLWP